MVHDMVGGGGRSACGGMRTVAWLPGLIKKQSLEFGLSVFWILVFGIVVVFSLNVADAILTEAGLSFIGLGLPPDIPDWGYDVSKGHSFLVAGHWWMITFPGIMITLVATGFSLLGEGLSEILNPRLVKN